jgi:hypothetical protein
MNDEASYRRSLRAAHRALRPRVTCACGCGRTFKPTRAGHVFYDDACRQRHHRNGRARVTRACSRDTALASE